MTKIGFYFLLLFALFAYALNLRLDVMEVDAAQYAQMSWQMLHDKEFLQIHCGQNTYLDKPPLLFWLNSLSFWLLGISNFSYKLPSLLFALLGIYSNYRFSKIYYTEKIAQTTALMLASSQAMFLMTNDVRTDTMLMGAVIFSIWQWAQFFETSKTKNLLLGSMGVALALLAKGPIGLIVTGAALFPHLLWKKKLNRIFDVRIVLSVFVIALLLAPMCIGLYQQFGMKGLKFYFWTQSFGRITGESEWNNHPDPFFLVHSTAWAFLPWTVFFFVGWLKSIWSFVRSKFSTTTQPEIISLSGFTLILLSLSLSKYLLPHYIFVVFPLAAVIAASYFEEGMNNAQLRKFIVPLQSILIFGLCLVAAFLQYAFKGIELFSLLVLIAMPVSIGALFFKTKNWFYASAFAIIYFNVLLSGFNYPEILKYQPQSEFGKYMHTRADEQIDFVSYQSGVSFSPVFYAQRFCAGEFTECGKLHQFLEQKKKLFVITSENGLADLRAENISFKIIYDRKTFPVSKINGRFLNPAKRESVCEKIYLLEAVAAQ